jgi:hypothetical protein
VVLTVTRQHPSVFLICMSMLSFYCFALVIFLYFTLGHMSPPPIAFTLCRHIVQPFACCLWIPSQLQIIQWFIRFIGIPYHLQKTYLFCTYPVHALSYVMSCFSFGVRLGHLPLVFLAGSAFIERCISWLILFILFYGLNEMKKRTSRIIQWLNNNKTITKKMAFLTLDDE